MSSGAAAILPVRLSTQQLVVCCCCCWLPRSLVAASLTDKATVRSRHTAVTYRQGTVLCLSRRFSATRCSAVPENRRFWKFCSINSLSLLTCSSQNAADLSAVKKLSDYWCFSANVTGGTDVGLLGENDSSRTSRNIIIGADATAASLVRFNHRCKKLLFCVFFILVTFFTFLTFFIFQTFFYF